MQTELEKTSQETVNDNSKEDTSLSKPSERARDEKGRFARYPKYDKLNTIVDEVLNKEEHQSKVIEEPTQVPIQKEEIKPEFKPNLNPDDFQSDRYKRVVKNADKPLSWASHLDDTWNSLRNYVLKGEGSISREQAAKLMENIYKREEQVAYGIESANSKLGKYKNMFTPYLNEIHSNNLKEEDFFKALADTHIQLKYAPLSQKIDMFKQMGKLYGIPVDGNTIGNSNLPPNVERELYESQQQLRQINNEKYLQEMQHRDTIESQLYKMQEDTDNYPHFNEVSSKMAELAKVNDYDTLDDLYDDAVELSFIDREDNTSKEEIRQKDDLITRLTSRLDALEKQLSSPKKEELNKLSIKTSQPSQSISTTQNRTQRGPSNSRLEILRRQFNDL